MASKPIPPTIGRSPPPRPNPNAAPAAPPEPAKPTGRPEQKRSDARQTSLEAGRVLRQMLDAAPAAKVAKNVNPATAKSAQRALDVAATLDIQVPEGIVNDVDVEVALERLQRMLSYVRARGHEDKLKPNDEVLLDLTGYVGGETFLNHPDTWFVLKPNKLLPGLFESLVGASVPDQRIVQLPLPKDYPDVALQGALAVYAITVKEGRGRTLMDPKSPLFLQLVNRGKTLAELKANLKQDAIKERASQMVELAKILMLRELYRRCQDDEVPTELVDEELTRRWRERKGDGMIQQGLGLEEQKASQKEFAADPSIYAEARRTVWELRILESIATLHGIEVNDAQLKPVLRSVFGGELDIDGHLYKNPGLHKDLVKGMRMQRAAELLLKKVKSITFDAPPTPKGAGLPPLTPIGAPAPAAAGPRTGLGGAKAPAPAAADAAASDDHTNPGNVSAARGLVRPPSKAPPK